jgi:histidyl-tRNA synthetase
VFEAFDKKGRFRAIAGGGRYDNLVKLISGSRVQLPAVGFGMGDVVLTELLRERGLLPSMEAAVDLFCLVEDEAFRPDSLRLIQELREAGFMVDYSFVPAKSDKQFKRAQESRSVYTCRVEQRDGGPAVARFKELATREELVADRAHAVREFKSWREARARPVAGPASLS